MICHWFLEVLLQNNMKKYRFLEVGLHFGATLQHFFFLCGNGAIHPQVWCYFGATLQHFFDRTLIFHWFLEVLLQKSMKKYRFLEVGLQFGATLQHFFLSMWKRCNTSSSLVLFRNNTTTLF